MKTTLRLIAYCCSFVLFISCQQDAETPTEVIFNGMDISKTVSFTDEPIVVTIDGSGFANAEVSSNVGLVKFKKITGNSYEVSSTEAVKATIYVSLVGVNGALTGDTQTFNVEFVEHGVKNYSFVEGIEINVDPKTKLVELFGEAEYSYVNDEGNYEYFYYFKKGIWFVVSTTSSRVIYARFYGIGWNRTFEEVTYTGKPYSYQIEDFGSFLDNDGVLMDKVVQAHGLTQDKFSYPSPSTTKRYTYYMSDVKNTVEFYFSSLTEEAYQGRKILYMNID